jgi:FlaA1/EpsC-like NDP-sugar epimerase
VLSASALELPRMDLRLQDKAVLVTGATKGIGAATARA